jgi:hypothetical protein
VAEAVESAGPRVRVFGGLQVEGLTASELGSRKARTLLAVLALSRGAPAGIDRLASGAVGAALASARGGAARHVRASLAEGGTFLLVEPMAGEDLDANLNPVGRMFYAVAPFICSANARVQQGPHEAGFGRAAETPFNRIVEARP